MSKTKKVEQATLNFLPQDDMQIVESSTPTTAPAPTEQPSEQQPVFAVTKGNIGTAVPWTGDQIAQALGDPKLHANVKEVRAEHDEQKQKELKEQKKFGIIGICPHFTQFHDNHRAAAEALAECCTYKTCVDCDDRAFGQQTIEGALRLNSEPGMWHNKVTYIENSLRGNGKCHIWLIQPVGMTAIETQEAFCKALGIPCDDSVQQKQSFILMTGDVVYQSPDFLRPLSPEQIDARQTAFRLRGLSIDGWDKATDSTAKHLASTNVKPVATSADTKVAPNARTIYIFDRCLKEAGLQRRDLTEEGGRHNALKSVLSTGACQLLTRDELNGVLTVRMPDYGQSADIQRLVNDFYQKYHDEAQRMTEFQRRVLAESLRLGEKQQDDTDTTSEATGFDESSVKPCDGATASLTDIYASPVPPMMPTLLPPVQKAILKPVPAVMRPTVSMGVMPALGAYPKKFRVLYTDGQYREPRLNSLTVGPQGDGKDSSLRGPLGAITKPMKERSSQARREIRAYNEAYNTKASNKEKPRREEFVHTAVQYIKSDITRARLNQAVDEAQGATLYVYMNELSKMEDLEGRYGARCRYDIINTADDEDNDFGQDRAGSQSVIADTCLRLNYNANTTVEKAHKLLDHVVHEGPVSRATFNTTPVRPTGAPRLRYGKFDEAYEASLKPYLDNLQAATGSHECKQACRLLDRLEKEVSDYVVQTQDKVYERLSHRALAACFRRAIVLWAASGMKWSRSFEGWLRWSLHWDLWIKLSIFGEQLHKSEQESESHKRGPRNMLEQLSDEFTLKDAAGVRQLNGMKEEGTSNMLSQWKHRGYIEELPDGRFRKIPKKEKSDK